MTRTAIFIAVAMGALAVAVLIRPFEQAQPAGAAASTRQPLEEGWPFSPAGLEAQQTPWSVGVRRGGKFVQASPFVRDGLRGLGAADGDHNPSVLFNATNERILLAGVLPFEPGELGLHPGRDAELVLRFTAPNEGLFQVIATLRMKHANGVSVQLTSDGALLESGVTKPMPLRLDHQVALAAGAHLDVVIGTGPFGYDSNTTSIELTAHRAR